MAVEPVEGKVVSPVDGEISALFDTKHAIGITAKDGTELLIHIGINTVELGGNYFTAHITKGDMVTKGQLLVEFDIDKIKEAGYEVTTPVLITSGIEEEELSQKKEGAVKAGETLYVK